MKEKIYKLIVRAGRDGISSEDIEAETGLTVHYSLRFCRELEAEGLIGLDIADTRSDFSYIATDIDEY